MGTGVDKGFFFMRLKIYSGAYYFQNYFFIGKINSQKTNKNPQFAFFNKNRKNCFRIGYEGISVFF